MSVHPTTPRSPRLLKWVALFIAAITLSLLVSALQRVRPRQVQALLDQGDTQRAGYLYFSAIKSYRQAAQSDPRDPEPLLRLGEAYLELRQYLDAIEAFAAASQRGGTTPEIHIGLARALEGHGDLAGAESHWRQAITQQPGKAQAYLGLARILIAQAEWDKARAALAGLLERQADHAEGHFRLGQLLALDKPALAQAHWQAAAASNPAYAIRLAGWLEALDKPGELAYHAAQLGRLFLAEGELHLAWQALGRAVEINPAYAEAHAYLGHVLNQLGDDGGRHLARAVELAPDSVIVCYLEGLHLRQSGDLAGAKAAFEAALALDPANAGLAVEIGLTALQNQAYVEGETWLVKAVELEPDNPAWTKQLAHFYLNQLITVEEKGLPSAEQAVRLAPDDAEAHDLLGWAYYLTGQLGPARAELQRALDLNPRHAAAHYHIAAVLAALGQPEEARLENERAASLDPAGEIGRRARLAINEK